jgi:hypothetical protein
MLINITGGDPDEYWKRAVLLSTLTTMDQSMYPNTFRGIAERMLVPLLEWQVGFETYDACIVLREHSREPIDGLPGRPSCAHMVETLYSEWGQQCMGQNFWVETWKKRARYALSQGLYVVACDADSEAEKQAILDICEHPIVIDAGDQRFKEGMSYFPHTANGEMVEHPSRAGCVVLINELQSLFAEHSLKLA